MPSLTKVQTGFMEAQGALPLSSGTAAAPGLKFDDHAGTGMFSPSTGEIAFSTSGHSQAVTFKTDGKVGIGTDNPSYKFQVENSGTTLGRFLRTNAGAGLFQIMSQDGGSITLGLGDVSDPDIQYIKSDNSDNSLSFGTDADERLRISSDGKVGISEASPQELLHLNDGANSAIMFGNTTNGYKIRANVTSSHDYGLLIEDEDGVDLYRATSSTGTTNADTHTFFTAGSERLRITSDGKIGVNNNDPLYAMHFKNAMSSSPSFIHMEVTGSNTVGGGGGIAFDTSASNALSNNGLYLATISGVRNSADDGSNDLVFKTSKSGVAGDDGSTHSPKERLRITSDGRVAINRITPSFMLDIIGNSSTGANCIRITDGAETGHGSHPVKIVAGGVYYHEMQMHSRRFAVHTYDGSSIAERFRVHQTGQVLINDTSLGNSRTDAPLQIETGSSGNALNLRARSSDDIYSYINFQNNSATQTAAEIHMLRSAVNNGGNLVFGTANANSSTPSQRMMIHSTGATTMHVNSASHETFRFTTQGANEAKFIMKDASSTNDIVLNTGGDTFFQGGNVAIGHNSPSQLLHLKGSPHALRIERTGTGPGYLDIALSHANANRYGTVYFDADTSGNTSDFIFRHGVSSSYAEKFRIDKTGNYVSFGGANVRSYGGTSANNISFTIDIALDYTYGGGLLIANGWHYGNAGYGASRISMVSTGPAGLIEKNIENSTTTQGGSWSFSRVNNNTIRVSKVGGPYNGGIAWNVCLIGN